MRLSQYPYVIMRMSCRRCGRRGVYRIVRLAARFGADVDLYEIREALTADCEIKRAQVETEQNGRIEFNNRCGLCWPDLSDGGPYDMPP